MRIPATSRTADTRGLAALGMTLALAAVFATSMAAFLIAAEIKSPGMFPNTPEQHAALESPRQ